MAALVAVVAYLLAAGAAWVGLSRVGYPDLRYSDLAWPGHWPRVRVKQAEYFRRLGWEAWTRQDYAQALVALSSARQIERSDYQTALFLAMLWSSSGNVAYGDTLFEQLLEEFPDQADRTRVVYHDQLLASLRLGPLAELALARRLEAAGNRAAWEDPLHFAVRHGRLATWLFETRASELARLPDESRQLVEALRFHELGQRADSERVIAAIRPYSADGLTHLIEAWLTMGRTDDAGFLLETHRDLLSGFEASVLRYRITISAGDRTLAESDFLAVVSHPLTPNQADRAVAAVILARDPVSLRRLWRHLKNGRPAYGRAVLAAVWVAALHTGEDAIADEAAHRWAGGGAERLPSLAERERRVTDPASLQLVLLTVALPRETVFALVAGAAHSRGAKSPPGADVSGAPRKRD